MFNVFVNFLYVCGMILAAALTIFVAGGVGFSIVTSIKDVFFSKKDKGDKND